MKILIIGGTGVLSTDIVLRSLECGHAVSVLNRGHHISEIPKGVRIIKTNVRDVNDMSRKIKREQFDVVVDFLSFTERDLKTTFDFFKDKCKQFIFISSACVFRRSLEDGIISEDSPKPNINLPYSIKKYACEKWLWANSKDVKCKYTIVRPYITYGDTRIPFGIAPLARYHWTIVARILNDKAMFLWDDGTTKCTLTHTKDFAYNFVQLYLNERAYNEDINLVGDFVYTWREMLEILYDILGKSKDIVSIPTSQIVKILPCYKDELVGDRSLNAVFDNSKLKRIIPDYRQTITLERGIRATLNYYQKNGCLDGIDYKYDGRIDKLIKCAVGRKFNFIDYLGSHCKNDRIHYDLYRILPEKFLSLLGSVKRRVDKIW